MPLQRPPPSVDAIPFNTEGGIPPLPNPSPSPHPLLLPHLPVIPQGFVVVPGKMARLLITVTPLANGRLALPVSWLFPSMPWLLLHPGLNTHQPSPMLALVTHPAMLPLGFAMVFSRSLLAFRVIGLALVLQSAKGPCLPSPRTLNQISPMMRAH